MAMELPLARPGEVIDAWSTWDDAEGVAYVLRTEHMEVMRLPLNAGSRIPKHEAQGEITILCVQGRAEMIALEQKHELNTGQLLYLLVQEPFDLRGVEESSLLITVLCQAPSERALIVESPKQFVVQRYGREIDDQQAVSRRLLCKCLCNHQALGHLNSA